MSTESGSARPATAPSHDRRWQRTRSTILNAGQTLFASRAMEGVTIDDIVTTAKVAKGSFYNHFEDKEELARTIVELVQGDCEFHIFAANNTIDDPAARIARALCVMLRYAGSHPERLQALLSLSVRSTRPGAPLNAGVTADLQSGLETKRFSGIYLESGLVIVIGIMRVTVRHAMTSGTATSAPELAATVGAAILRALGVHNDEATTIANAASQTLLRDQQ